MKKTSFTLMTALCTLLLLLTGLALGAQQLSNCPASPYPVTVKQEDGTSITIVGKGGMLHSWTETADGYTVVKKDGVYLYATKRGGKLEATNIKATDLVRRSATEKSFVQQLTKSIKPDAPTISDQPQLYPATSNVASNADEPQKVGYPATGNLRALLLLIRYPDLPATYTTTNFNNLMNQANYRGTGSFKDFYTTSSFGQLNVTTDVFGWYTASQPYTYYGYANGWVRSTQLVREAVNAAQAAGVDFSQYDNDNDGVVDGIIVAHAGPGAEEGSQGQYIWSHRWVLSAGGQQVTYDGVLINDYIINPERRQYTADMVGRGIFCHEFGHNLGLPDLYDTDGGSEGLGEWSLMASASWLGNEHTPGNMCAWSRDQLNWLSPTVLTGNGTYSLNAAATSAQVYRINTPVASEYFLLENRQKTGLDISLNGSGLAIFHVNTSVSGNANEALKMVDLEEADGLNDLDNQWNRGDAGDVYPGSASKTVFNNTSNPNSTTYNGAASNVNISSIAINGSGQASFTLNLGTASPPVVSSFLPASAPVGAGIYIKGSNFSSVTAVRINGVATTDFYVASSTRIYASVPSGATTGKVEVVANGLSGLSSGNLTVASVSSTWSAKAAFATARSQHGAVGVNSRIYIFGGMNSTDLLNSTEAYRPTDNNTFYRAAMPDATRGLSYAAGADGLVYAVSGFATSGHSTSLYRFNPTANTWSTLASIPNAVWEGAAAATTNNKVFVFGGEQTNGTVVNTTRIYDIATNTWSTGAAMPTGVQQHSAVTGNDGKIYVFGGRTGSSSAAPVDLVQIYNPSANTWSTGAAMPIPKAMFGAAKAGDGRIYIVGGKAQYFNNAGPFFHTVEIYNPATNTWSTGPVLPIPLGELEAVNLDGNIHAVAGTNGTYRNTNYQLTLAALPAIASFLPAKGPAGVGVMIKGTNLSSVTGVKFNGTTVTQTYKASNGLLYVTVPSGATTGKIELISSGGSVLTTTNFTVEPITSTWTAKTGVPTPRVQQGTAATGGKIYVFGGRNVGTVLSSMEIYNVATNTWSTGTPMPVATRGMAVALGNNNAIYAFGGVTGAPVDNTYKYNPVANTWEKLGAIPEKVFEAAAAGTPDGKVYIFGGEPSTAIGTSVATTRIYTITGNTWSTGAAMPVAVQQHSAVRGNDGKIYIIGGRTLSAGPPVGLVQIYNPATNTWSSGAPMPIPKVQFGCVKGDNGLIYVIGGKASEPNFTGPFFHTVEIYNPATNTWSTGGQILPTPYGQQTAVNINGNLYALTGSDATPRNYNYQLIVPPAAPTNLVASAISSSQIKLTWTDNAANESNYMLERSTSSSGPFTALITLSANTVTFTNRSLAANTTYYYRLKGTNTGGSSSYSNTASAKTLAATAVANASAERSINAAVEDKESEKITRLSTLPNPVTTSARISFSVSEDLPVQLGVFDAQGNLLDQLYKGSAAAGKTYQFEWKVNRRPAGVYYSRLITPKGVKAEKMIVHPH